LSRANVSGSSQPEHNLSKADLRFFFCATLGTIMLNRRSFLKRSLTAGAAIIPSGPVLHDLNASHQEYSTPVDTHGSPVEMVTLPRRLASLDPATLSWQQRIRRVGQTNMTEYDGAAMNVEQWADYWHAAKADIVFVSVTGILAFYPSKVMFHRHGKFLKGRDIFGECVSAAKKRGMRVVARMSPDLNWPDALAAHPEWAMRHRDESVQHNNEDPRLFQTCMFSSYMDDYVPAIMREVSSLYDVDCFYTNGWPPLGSLPDCHCAICSKLPPSNTSAYWRVFTDRVLELWRKYDAIAKQKKSDCFFFANSGGNVRGGPNLNDLGKVSAWFQADNQGRSYGDSAIWGCSLQGRVCNAVLDGKFAANVTAAYSTGNPVWRNVSKNPAEIRMWLNETRHGSVSSFRRRREWFQRRPPLAADRCGVFSVDRAARCPPHNATLHRQYRSRDRSKHAASLSRTRIDSFTGLHARNDPGHLSRSAPGTLRLRLRP
jgi:hypothetical protein